MANIKTYLFKEKISFSPHFLSNVIDIHGDNGITRHTLSKNGEITSKIFQSRLFISKANMSQK